ncbi:MAG: elongation factor Ts [Gammaproteobacteria bacterium]|nr:elongation factor Ts [Gammaproteobacteria bacterium]
MSITASMVSELRQRTGAGMMECKKFLQMTNGDIEQAVLEMRKAGQAKADKKADRIAAEGIIVIARDASGRHAVMLEVNSETDFVARDAGFMTFANAAAETALHTKSVDIQSLMNQKVHNASESVEEARQQLVAKIGENIQVRRLVHLESNGIVGAYSHGARIGVLVAMENADDVLAKDIAMQIAANRPQVVRPEEVSAEAIAVETEVFMAQARESGKPEAIIEKMIQGRLSKFVEEVSLMGQPFVKDPSVRVDALLKKHNATVSKFVCYQVGEGIEKREDNFVEEVMAQVRQ